MCHVAILSLDHGLLGCLRDLVRVNTSTRCWSESSLSLFLGGLTYFHFEKNDEIVILAILYHRLIFLFVNSRFYIQYFSNANLHFSIANLHFSNANLHFSSANLHFSSANLHFSNANLHFSTFQ
jgi:hypothetical protein